MRVCAALHKDGRRVFDVLGHLDLAKRYTQRFFQTVEVDAHRDVIDDILAACLEADIVPEINTSSLRQEVPAAMPDLITVRRYRDLGGRAMSLGSDAHRSEDIGVGLDTAVEMLESAGIGHISVFRERVREDLPWT